MFVLNHFLVGYVNFHESELLLRIQMLDVHKRPHYIERRHKNHELCNDLDTILVTGEVTAIRQLLLWIQTKYSRVRWRKWCLVLLKHGKVRKRGSSNRFHLKTSRIQRVLQAEKQLWILFALCFFPGAIKESVLPFDVEKVSSSRQDKE